MNCSISLISLGYTEINISSANASTLPFFNIFDIIDPFCFSIRSRDILKKNGLIHSPCGVHLVIIISSQSSEIAIHVFRSWEENTHSLCHDFQSFHFSIFHLIASRITFLCILSNSPSISKAILWFCSYNSSFYYFLKTILPW